MKKRMTVFIALSLLALGGAAWAQDTNNLTVNATVNGTCKFTSTTSSMSFGTLDPNVPGPIPGVGSTQFWCTKGVTLLPFTIGDGQNFSGGSRRMAGPGGDFIPYSLTLTPDIAGNTGPVTPRTLTFGGSIIYADYAGVSAGAYTDLVQLTINP